MSFEFPVAFFLGFHLVSEFLIFVLFWMQWILINVNKAKFSQKKHLKLLVKSRPWGALCISLSLLPWTEFTSWKTLITFTCMPAYFCHYYFPWSTWHVMFSNTKFHIRINISQVTFYRFIWIKPHSPSLTNLERLRSIFCQSVQICSREGQREENNGNGKGFCVTRKQNDGNRKAFCVIRKRKNQQIGQNIILFLLKSTTFLTLLNS